MKAPINIKDADEGIDVLQYDIISSIDPARKAGGREADKSHVDLAVLVISSGLETSLIVVL